MAVAPSRARPVWLVTSPTRLPRSGANRSARSASSPETTGGHRPGDRQRRAAEIAPGERCRVETRRHRLDRRRGDCRHPRPERGDVALAIGMDAVGQEDDEHPRQRVDPERRAREAGVPERSDRQQLAAVARIAGVDVPAERTQVAILARRHRRGHLRHGERREDPPAAVRAVVEQHAAEDRQVGRGAEQPRVAGDAVHPPRGRIVNDAPQHLAAWAVARVAVRRAALRRRDPRDQRRRRIEHRVFHAERLEDVLLGVLVERLAADPPHNLAEQKEVDVAVDEAGAGRCRRHFLDSPLDGGVGADPLVEIDVRPEARDVRQQVADGDVGFAVALESRNEGRHAIDEAQLALLDQHHHARRRRHHLGQGGDVEHRVERHRLGRRHQRPVADRFLINDAIADANQDDGARQAFLADLVANQRLDRVELADVEAGGCRRPLLTRRERHAVRGSRQDEGDGGGCEPGEAICHGLRTARG